MCLKIKKAVWPDGTICDLEDLDEYLTFMSDDYVVEIVDESEDEGECIIQ